MKLSEHFNTIITDAEFDVLGKLHAKPGKRMLAFAEKSSFVKNAIGNPDVTAIVTTQELAAMVPDTYGVAISDSPRHDFCQLHNKLAENEDYIGRRFPSVIPKSCRIHTSAVVSPYNVVLGENVVIEPYVYINENVTIGDNSVVRVHSSIGTTQFDFYKYDGVNMPVTYCGHVRIGKDFEMQEHGTIGRGIFPWQATVIGNNTKTSNFVSIGDGSDIGDGCLISSMTVLCGNVTLGDNVWIGSGCTVSNKITVESDASVSIGAVVMSNVPKGQTVSGYPAVEHRAFLKDYLQRLRKN